MTTGSTPLTATAWAEICDGAAIIETKHLQNARLHFGAAAPALESADFHDLSGPSSFTYTGSQKGFARAYSGTCTVIVTDLG